MALTLNGTTGIAGIAGSAGTPALQGNNDANTGYFFATDTLGLSTAGSERLRIDANGDVMFHNYTDNIGSNSSGEGFEFRRGEALRISRDQGLGLIVNRTSDDGDLITLRRDGSGKADLGIRSNALTFDVAGSERLRITSTGQILVGTTSDGGTYDGVTPDFVSEKSSTYQAHTLVVNANHAGQSSILQFVKSRGTSNGANTIVQDGDRLGSIYGIGADGTNRDTGAVAIDFRVDGTPGTNDMPGRIEFRTTNDGAAVPSEKVVIKADGKVGIGTASPSTKLSLEGSSGTTSHGILIGAKNAGGIRGVVEVHTAASTVGFNLSRTGGGSDTDVVRLEMDADSNGLIQVRNSSNAQRVRLDNHGIKFGTDTAAANALDDYEEGTWTPETVTGTWGQVTGYYTKIGQQVFLTAYMYGCNTTSGSDLVKVDNLPFAPISGMTCGTVITEGSNAFTVAYMNGAGYIVLAQNDGGSSIHYMEHSDISAGGSTGRLHINANYRTNA